MNKTFLSVLSLFSSSFLFGMNEPFLSFENTKKLTVQFLGMNQLSSSTPKPFPCPHQECSKSFTTQGYLKKHINLGHKKLTQNSLNKFLYTFKYRVKKNRSSANRNNIWLDLTQPPLIDLTKEQPSLHNVPVSNAQQLYQPQSECYECSFPNNNNRYENYESEYIICNSGAQRSNANMSLYRGPHQLSQQYDYSYPYISREQIDQRTNLPQLEYSKEYLEKHANSFQLNLESHSQQPRPKVYACPFSSCKEVYKFQGERDEHVVQKHAEEEYSFLFE